MKALHFIGDLSPVEKGLDLLSNKLNFTRTTNGRQIQVVQQGHDLQVTKNEEQIKLTPKEARLLELLYNYKDGLLPREKALTEIWGTNDYFTARSMDVYVTKLRKYFKDDQNIKIENVHGSGFRLVIEE